MTQNKLKEFVEFWDEWHREWYELISDDSIRDINKSLTDQILRNVKGKRIFEILDEDISKTMVKGLPLIREKFKIDNIDLYSAEIIPEPYWGKINFTKKLSSIFININPYLGPGAANKHYEEIFKKEHFPYSEHLNSNSSIENLTTLWLKQKRGIWLYNLQNRQIPKIKGKTDYNEIDISQLLSCDFVPWHTPKKTDLSRYLKQQSVIDFISIHQIDRIAELALEQIENNSCLHNKVIVRSSVFIDYINMHEKIREKFDDDIEYFVIQNAHYFAKKFSSYLTIVTHKIYRTRFYIFSDGVSMELPDLNYIVHKLNKDNWIKCTLRDFIENDKNSPNSV